MKKLKYIIITMCTLLLLTACQQGKNHQKLGDILDLKEDKIKNIIVETTMTKNKTDLVLEKKDYKKFLDKLSSYNTLEIKNNNEKGWQYFIKIEADEDILISIMDNEISVNDKLYISDNLDKYDFLYLFENR
ncbi:hypothetical protein [Helcococcus massiliensis]|uniref:hypothetical protein n=1 Tax=Helcococcus massiliensis TaxID=2040290 RepID=UPI000CDEDE95|nr:hypothetical protein [Helcococcus massiliensis]